jgi:hypothetical protein
MSAAERQTTPRQGHIHLVCGQLAFKRIALERTAPGIEGLLDGLLGRIDFLAGRRPFFRRQLAQVLEPGRELAVLTEETDPDGIERSEICSGIYCGFRLLYELAQCLH